MSSSRSASTHSPTEPDQQSAADGWVFARDLLAEGLRRPSGTGDVRVWPIRSHGQHVVCIALNSPTGQATLLARGPEVASFLKRSEVAVPPGAERCYLDLDIHLARILADS